MGLEADVYIYEALKAGGATEAYEGRVFNTARDTESDSEDRIPYAIVMLNGMSNDSATKDDEREGGEDEANVELLIVAKNREELARLTNEAREAIRENLSQEVEDYDMSASGVQYDWTKPCYFQSLRYVMRINN